MTGTKLFWATVAFTIWNGLAAAFLLPAGYAIGWFNLAVFLFDVVVLTYVCVSDWYW